MPKVVCNTTPIISLLKIGQLDLLQKLYSAVTVPNAVWEEIEAGKNKPYYIDLKTLDWIQIQGVQFPLSAEFLTDLDRGEAEVIVLGREIQADLVIIDETLGRQFAEHLGLRVTGTLGILLRAKKEGHVTAIKPLLELLRDKGIRVMRDVVLLAGE